MGNINSSLSTGTADLSAWPSSDSISTGEQGVSQVAARPTSSPSPNLPAPRAARGAGAGSTGYTDTGSRRPLAQSLGQLPDELLHQIGEHLVNLPESSSLKAAASTSLRLHRVFFPLRDQSMQKFRDTRTQFMHQLRNDPLVGGSGPQRLFLSLRDKGVELRSYVVNDSIDYIDNTSRGDNEKSVIMAALLEELPHLVSQSELPPTAARLVAILNCLSLQEQGPSLVAIARLIKKFPRKASEPWIAGLTHALATEKQKLSPELRQAIICEVADLTRLVSDDKKPVHIINVLMLIGGLPADYRSPCYSRLGPYKQYTIVSGIGGTLVRHFGQQLANKLLGSFSSRPQP